MISKPPESALRIFPFAACTYSKIHAHEETAQYVISLAFFGGGDMIGVVEQREMRVLYLSWMRINLATKPSRWKIGFYGEK